MPLLRARTYAPIGGLHWRSSRVLSVKGTGRSTPCRGRTAGAEMVMQPNKEDSDENLIRNVFCSMTISTKIAMDKYILKAAPGLPIERSGKIFSAQYRKVCACCITVT